MLADVDGAVDIAVDGEVKLEVECGGCDAVLPVAVADALDAADVGGDNVGEV